MLGRLVVIAAVAALAMAGAGGVAHAQAAKPKSRAELTAGQVSVDQNAWGSSAQRRSLQWSTDGRWGVKLDFDQPRTRDVDWRDVEAGAYFRVTPSLRVGGSVGLGAQAVDPKRTEAAEERPQPRVRLETTFRF